MLKSNESADIAIAYWGSDALRLLKVNPGRKNIRVVCCLKGGKSDPDVISKFKKRAKQHDKLHAKVIWTPRAAIVGSANASSNGLPQEELKATGLIEAGLYLEDRATLDDIQSWFQDLFLVRAKGIESSDLEEARLARLLAPKAGGTPKTRSSKKSLLELAVVQTFHSTKGIRVKTNEGHENLHFALYRGKNGFNFRLTREDTKAIRACSRQLWRRATGSDDGKCISLRKAAPILLGLSKR
jgi:hypothetical protein